MNNLHLSKEAQNDLAEIKVYITKELENPNAVLATVSRITKKIHVLKNHA
jgi:plasmid stabilization system protein ParE